MLRLPGPFSSSKSKKDHKLVLDVVILHPSIVSTSTVVNPVGQGTAALVSTNRKRQYSFALDGNLYRPRLFSAKAFSSIDGPNARSPMQLFNLRC